MGGLNPPFLSQKKLMRNFKVGRLWGVLGKQQSYSGPTPPTGNKVPLNNNPMNSWDYKKSNYRRLDGRANAIQQGGAVPQDTPTPTPTPVVWNPSQLNNLWDWWTSTSGVNTTGGSVDTWDGYSGNTLVPYNPLFKASFNSTDSNFNNQPSIQLNPNNTATDCGYYVPLDGIGKTGTVIMVAYINQKYTNDLSCLWANSMPTDRYTMFGDNGSSAFLIYKNNGSPQAQLVGSNFTNGNYMLLRGDYDYSTGDSNFYQSNTNTFTNQIGVTSVSTPGYNYNTSNLTIGSYYGVYGGTSNISIVEIIKIDGIPTNTELTQLSSYLTSKYGL